MKASRFQPFAVTFAWLALASVSARAADLTWDTLAGDGAGITAGSGVWDTAGTNLVWNDGADNVAWSQTNITTPLHAALFAGTDGVADSYTVALVAQMAAQSLAFNSSGYRITGSIVYLGIPGTTPANGPITVAADKTATISSVLGYNHNRAATVTVGAGGVLNLGGGTQGNNRPQMTLTGDGTVNITAGTHQSTIGNRNAAVINQSGGTWTMTDQSPNVTTSIGSNAGRDVNYTVSSAGTLNVLASNDTAATYTLSLGRNMGNFTSTLTLQSGGTVNIGVTANRAGQINLGSFDANGNSLLDVQGGTLTVGTGKAVNKLYFFAAGANAGKTATMAQSGGTATLNGIQFGANSGDTAGGLNGANTYAADSAATLRLSGGNLYVGAQGITRGTAAAALPVTIQLQGGTLGAAQNWSSPMDMKLTAATIRAADSGGAARNISLSGDLANDDAVAGTLTKTGLGTLTLAGANTYTGATTVSEGELKHSSAGSAATDITVAAGATKGVRVEAAEGQWVNSGSHTHADGSAIHIDFGVATPSTTIAPMKVAGLLLGTGLTMRIDGLVSGFLPGQTYPLVTWTGGGPLDAAAFATVVLPAGISGTLGVAGDTLALSVTGNTSLLAWNTGDGAWDVETLNWLDASQAPATYVDLVVAVMFGDAPGVTGDPTVTLDATYSPLGILMKSASHDYTIAGTGTIAGGGGLVLDATNTRTLTLANANNTFTGSTTIGGGTLRLGAAGRLGNGNYAGAIAIADAATFENAGEATQTLSGPITGTGGSVKLSGNGQFILSSGGNSYGALSIGDGRVFISSNAGALPAAATVDLTGGILVFGTGASYANAITVASGGGIATRNAAGTGLTGAVTLPDDGTVVFNNDDATTRALSIASDQTLTGNLIVQIGGNRTNANPVGGVTLSGKLTGEGALTVASSGQAASIHFGTGVLTLTGANDYSGGTTLSQGTLTIGTGGTLGAATGALAVGNDNTIAAGTNVVLNLATATDTTVGSLSGTIATPASGTNTATINTQTGRTFTVNQTADGIYEGVVAGGGGLALGSLSTHSLTLAGANTYSGDTTVGAGTLVLAAAPDPLNANPANDASTITIAETGATLDLTYTGTDKVDKLFIGAILRCAGGVSQKRPTAGGWKSCRCPDCRPPR
jgi:fibronectin-binding autotransporter adhesin